MKVEGELDVTHLPFGEEGRTVNIDALEVLITDPNMPFVRFIPDGEQYRIERYDCKDVEYLIRRD